MALSQADRAQLIELESRLFTRGQGASQTRSYEELLADDFVEFGKSGKRYHRRDVLGALTGIGTREEEIAGSDFELRELAEGVALLTYRSVHRKPNEPGEQHALRSSIWVRRDGRWQIVFHQGTMTE